MHFAQPVRSACAATRVAAAVSALLFVTANASAAPTAATAAEVEALAARLPVLKVPEKGQPPFIARGSMPTDTDAYAYEIIWTGEDYRAALLDPDDGLPFLISDANTLYACDVRGGSIWVVVGGRVSVRVRSSPTGAALRTDSPWYSGAEPDFPDAQFDIRQAVLSAKERSLIETMADDSIRLVQPIDGDRTRVIQFEPLPSRNVSFAQMSVKEGRYTSYHSIQMDDVDVDSPAIKMPDLIEMMKKLGAKPNPPEIWQKGYFQTAGLLGKFRRAIRGNTALRQEFRVPPGGWPAAAKRSDELTAKWRTVLDEFKVEFKRAETPGATTQPTQP